MLVVFLGNPGSQYKLTRHNAGFMLADELDFLKNAVWSEKKRIAYNFLPVFLQF